MTDAGELRGMTTRQYIVGLFASFALGLAGPANAASIDFTGAFGASLDNISSYTSGLDPDGVQWTLEAKPGAAEFNYITGWGLGIKDGGGFDTHEAELPEYFELTFNKPVDNVLIGLNRLNRRGPGYLPYFEGGFYRVNGGPEVWFFQTVETVQGWYGLNLGDNITSIVFSGLGLRSPGVFNPQIALEKHGFKLASLDYGLDRINVAEPASMTLLGLGFAGVGIALRRRRRSA